jgi:iron complex transport system substrate-binding protein
MQVKLPRFMSLALMRILCLISILVLPTVGTASSTITVTDFQDRSVTIKAPVERFILLESSKLPEITALLSDDFLGRLVGWDNDFQLNAGDGYARFVQKYPALADVPDVGSMYEGTMSIEKVIDLKPDVVIAQKWMFVFGEEATRAALDRLDQAGIPVVFLDFWADPLKNSTESMRLLGRIFGREERAAEIVDFYNKQLALVTDHLQTTTSVNPSVYIECAYKGPAEYGLSYGDVAWGLIIKAAGGDNIATALLGDTAKALSPEYVLEKSPETVILTGRNWETAGSLRMGYLASVDQVKSTMTPFVERPGWDGLKAVKNKKVYGIYHGFCFSIFNYAAVQALAAWFHPEAFKEFDPEASLKEFHALFLPVEYGGTFLFSYY